MIENITQPDDFPVNVNAVIEIPKYSHNKYEIDHESGLLKLSRPLFSSMHYPGDYGYVPDTLWDDGDPIDLMVLTNNPVYPLTLAEVRVIGMIDLKDSEEWDVKLLGVYESDPRYSEYHDITDIRSHQKEEIVNFFSYYKQLEGKKVDVKSLENAKRAWKAIKKAKTNYSKANKAAK